MRAQLHPASDAHDVAHVCALAGGALQQRVLEAQAQVRRHGQRRVHSDGGVQAHQRDPRARQVPQQQAVQLQ